MSAAAVEQRVLAELGYAGVASEPSWTNGRPIEDVTYAYAPQGSNLVYFARADDGQDESVWQLHRRVWSQGEASLLFVTGPTRVRVLNGRAAPLDSGQAPELDSALVRSVGAWARLESYSRRAVEENPYRWSGEGGTSGLDYLATCAARAYSGLVGGENGVPRLPAETAQALLGRAVFIRYLTDRRSLTEDLTLELTGGTYGRLEDALGDVGGVRRLLDGLNDRFNGTVFPLPPPAWDDVRPEHLEALRQVVNQEGRQLLLWKLDFSHLPIGFFSRLFELFLDDDERRKAGAYYTPPSLVDFILAESMPLSVCDPNWRVLDPACGSGVFLARAFHRLALAWRRIHEREPALDDLSAILARLRGVDLDERAVRVTALSLYLAMLEHLPTGILHDPRFRLPPLLEPEGQTLRRADFFDPTLDDDLQPATYDRVLGNPPWGRGKETELSRAWRRKRKLPDAGMHAAPAFLWRAGELLRPEGEAALLAPCQMVAASLSDAQSFRQRFFMNHTVRVVADLALLRRTLFQASASPAAGLFYSAKPPCGDEQLLVAAPKPSDELHVGVVPLVTPADTQSVPLGELLSDSMRLLCARYGTSADAALLRRLRRRHNTLREECTRRGLGFGEGLKLDQDVYKPRPEDEVRGMPVIPPPAPTGISTDDVRAYVVRRLDGEALRPNMWLPARAEHVSHTGPLVLLHHTAKRWAHCRHAFEKRLAAAYLPEGRVYRHSLTGVTGEEPDVPALLWVLAFYNSSLASYVAFHTAHRWTEARGTLNDLDVGALPFFFPEADDAQLADALLEAHTDAERGGAGLPRLQQGLDDLVMARFGLSEREQALVEDTIRYSIPHFHWADASALPRALPEAEQPVDAQVLDRYAQRFVGTVSPLVEPERGPLLHAVRRPDSAARLAVVSFSYHREALDAARELDLDTLAEQSATDGVSFYLRRFVDVYAGEVLHCVRPNKQRFWTRSRASADAAAAIADWLDAGENG